jgi:hypothetical protein
MAFPIEINKFRGKVDFDVPAICRKNHFQISGNYGIDYGGSLEKSLILTGVRCEKSKKSIVIVLDTGLLHPISITISKQSRGHFFG